MCAVVIAPLLVIPGALNKPVIGGRALLIYRFKNVPAAKAILGIKFTAYHQHCGFYVLYTYPGIAGHPPGIAVGVVHYLVPEFERVAGDFGEIGQRAGTEIKLVIIMNGRIPRWRRFRCRVRMRCAATELLIKIKGVHLKKSAIMVKIITHKPIGNRGLRTNGL